MKERLVTQFQVLFSTSISFAMFAVLFVVQGSKVQAAGAPIAVLASPWRDPTEAIWAASGSPIGPTRALFGVFAASDPHCVSWQRCRIGNHSFVFCRAQTHYDDEVFG